MSAIASQGTAHRESPHQVLTFSLGAENFGVDILRVPEIRGWSPVTRIPKLPAHVLGVLNLRGAIVPIIDLSVKSAKGTREFGLVVDGVSDVEFIQGLAIVADRC